MTELLEEGLATALVAILDEVVEISVDEGCFDDAAAAVELVDEEVLVDENAESTAVQFREFSGQAVRLGLMVVAEDLRLRLDELSYVRRKDQRAVHHGHRAFFGIRPGGIRLRLEVLRGGVG